MPRVLLLAVLLPAAALAQESREVTTLALGRGETCRTASTLTMTLDLSMSGGPMGEVQMKAPFATHRDVRFTVLRPARGDVGAKVRLTFDVYTEVDPDGTQPMPWTGQTYVWDTHRGTLVQMGAGRVEDAAAEAIVEAADDAWGLCTHAAGGTTTLVVGKTVDVPVGELTAGTNLQVDARVEGFPTVDGREIADIPATLGGTMVAAEGLVGEMQAEGRLTVDMQTGWFRDLILDGSLSMRAEPGAAPEGMDLSAEGPLHLAFRFRYTDKRGNVLLDAIGEE